jgi:hypothetical protein
MPGVVKISDIRKFPSIDPARRTQSDTSVFFSVDDGPVIHVTIPGDVNDKNKIEAAIRAEIANRHTVIGHIFKV